MRHVICLSAIVGITAVVCSVGVAVEQSLFDVFHPQIPPPTKLSEWKDSFEDCARSVALVSGVTGIIWYVLAQWVFKIIQFHSAGKRGTWALLFVLPVIALVGAVIYLSPAETGIGLYLAYLFFALNSVVYYYILTLFISPSSFKYSPVGAGIIRRWFN